MRPGIRPRPRRAAILVTALAASLALLASGCATLTVEQERRLGRDLSREMRAEVTFVRDRWVVGYVERIGRDVLRAAGPQPFDYEFHVIESDDINAFAMPAGQIYVHTETILQSRNVSELAGVIAHEVGHVVLRHIAENYNRQRTASVGHQALVLGAGMAGGSAAAGAANLLGGLSAMAVLNSFGREAEAEADAFAVETMPRAGYDPTGVVTFFHTLMSDGGERAPSFLSSHPATEDRIAETRALIAAGTDTLDLKQDDGGRLEIIQRRIRLLTGRVDPRGEPAAAPPAPRRAKEMR